MNRILLAPACWLATPACWLAATACWLAAPAHAAELAVVIDDLGYSLERAERVLALPAPVTVAVLPFAPASREIAGHAAATGHDVILHQPMEPLRSTHGRLTPDTLMSGMPPALFDARVRAALAALPGIVGMNNHTGSRLTQDTVAMRRLMRHLAERDLVFLDSRTTAATVAYTAAREADVRALERDVFLDHVPRLDAIEAEFGRAVEIARRQGHAVVIAHPYEVSLTFLESVLRRLPEDVSLVALRRLADRTRPAALARHGSPTSPHRSLGQ